jgi:hypothetical protein
MKRKKTFYITTTLVILLIIIFFLPRIFSTRPGTDFLLKRIERKTNSTIKIESFNLTWFGPQIIKKLNYKDQNLSLQVESIISNMSLFSFYKSLKSYKKLNFFANTDINNLNVQFHFPNLPQASFHNVNAFIKADMKGLNSININGQTTENNKTGKFNALINFQKNKIYTKIVGTNIPTIGIDQLFFYNNKKYQNLLVQFLGPSLNLEIDSILDNLTGPINIDLNSSYSQAKLNIFYEKDKITLQDTATIIFNLPGINPNFIKNINYIKSIDPIIVRISKEDFSFPIFPFKLEKLNIKYATLDLNRMIVSNTGAIRSITNFAKMPSSQVVSLWFTYVNLQIKNGILYTDRMDFLINDDVQLCLWGNVNLLNHNLKMYLGITQDTLLAVFGIQNLPSDYVIKIPVKGTIENPKIDASAATAKILALSTLQTGKGIGSIIGGVITRIQKDEDIPPPKRPFPWEGKIKRKRSRQPPIDLNNIFDLFK